MKQNRGKLILKYRERANMTQQELADRVGTTPQNIYKYETGIVENIPLFRIEQLANALGVSPAVLAGWDIDPNDYPSEPDKAWDDIFTEVHMLPADKRQEYARSFLWHLRNNSIPAYTESELRLLYDYHNLSLAGKEYIQQTMVMAVQTYGGKNNALSDLEKAK